MKNENGFVLLLAIFILFLLSTTLMHHLSIYESEKRFFSLEKERNTLDNLIILSHNEIMILMEQEQYGNLVAGKLLYPSGAVEYEINKNGEVLILVKASTLAGKNRNIRYLYDEETGMLLNWSEGAQIQ